VSSPKRTLAALALITLVLLCNTFPTAGQTYTSAKEFLSGGTPSAVTTGDFNRDANVDVAVANYGTTVSVLLGSADGTFQASVDYPISTALLGGIAAGDFNGDARLDLAVTDRDGALFILFGNGDGTFQPALNLNIGASPVAGASSLGLAVGNFNGDQNLDIALLYWDPVNFASKILILLGNGDGTFHSTAAFDASGSLDSAVVADFNADGKLDLAVANSTGVSPSAPGVEGNLVVFLGNGDGTFLKGPVLVDTGGTFRRLSVADFNSDGKPDLALITDETGGGVRVFLGNGDGSFQSPALVPQPDPFPSDVDVASADLNGDGKPDLVVTLAGAVFDVQLGNGDGTFQPPLHFTLPNNGYFVAAKDLNGDGRPDLVFTDTNGIEVVRNNAAIAGSDLAVSIGRAQGTPLQAFSYSVMANNRGPNPASNVVVTDLLPTGSAVLYPLPSGCTGTVQITCTLSNIPPGGLASVHIAIWTPTSGGTIVDSASVSATEVDPDATNNNATVSDVVFPGNPILTLSVSKGGNGSGVVIGGGHFGVLINCGNLCSQSDVPGDTVDLSAIPDAGSSFTAWGGNCTGTIANSCRFILAGNAMVTATFSRSGDFSVSSPSSSFSTTWGSTATSTIALTPQSGFSGAIVLTCSVAGPSPLPTCSVSPSTIPAGSAASTATVTVSTPPKTAQSLPDLRFPNSPNSPSSAAFAIAVVFSSLGFFLAGRLRSPKLHASHFFAVLVWLLALFLSACGGGSTASSQSGENFTVTVNATSGSLSHVINFTLTVR
jgi:uncharacterized repeat protein (TIGR01451 family)